MTKQLTWSLRIATLNQMDMLSSGVPLSVTQPRLPRHVTLSVWRMARRRLTEFLKDGLTRRWSFPQFRGALAAAIEAPAIFLQNRANLEPWYKTRQLRVLLK